MTKDKDWPVLFKGALFRVVPDTIPDPDRGSHYIIVDADGNQALPRLFSTPFDANITAERMEKEAAGQRRLF